eukprot:SAG11_NODE_47968_length_126_cov_60.148148_1_plen_20_part_01
MALVAPLVVLAAAPCTCPQI